MKVVINTKVGGFRPSSDAVQLYYQRKGFERHSRISTEFLCYVDPTDSEKNFHTSTSICRHDPIFIGVVEELKEKANTIVCELKVVDIPDGIDYIIVDRFDGSEYIAEKHKTWE